MNNTVTLDLTIYNKLFSENLKLREEKEQIKTLLEKKYILPKDGFFIEKEYGNEKDDLVLRASKETIENIFKNFGNYDCKFRYSRDKGIRIGTFDIEVTEKESEDE